LFTGMGGIILTAASLERFKIGIWGGSCSKLNKKKSVSHDEASKGSSDEETGRSTVLIPRGSEGID